MPSAFQYGPPMFVPPASAKQHGVNLSTPPSPFQQASYDQHSYSTGYDDLTQGTAAGDYTKGGYGRLSQAPNRSAGSGPGKGILVFSSTTGLPDVAGSAYNKTQTFDKQGFHVGTPPPFSLPSALGSTGPLVPGAAPGYAPPPFLHILPAFQQPHSQLLHHLPQDAQSGTVSAASPAPCNPSLKPPNPPMQLSILDKLDSGERVGSGAGLTLDKTEHMGHISGSPVPFPRILRHVIVSAEPLWGACFPDPLLYVMYLCMYL
jgi:hypothetical protein